VKVDKLMPIIVRVKILPKQLETKPDEIFDTAKGYKLIKYYLEPIAFGLNAIIADFSLDDSEKGTDGLENYLISNPLVGEVEVLMVSNASTKVKPK
jgi:translation elongation factor EF-1beta